jgi:hypothetical protein
MEELQALLEELQKKNTLVEELQKKNAVLEREKLLNFDHRLAFFGKNVKGSHSYRSNSNNNDNNNNSDNNAIKNQLKKKNKES